MKYDPIGEELRWRQRGSRKFKPLPPRHLFAYSCVHSRLHDTLVHLGCDNTATVLDIGCGSGGDVTYVESISKDIIGVDVSYSALQAFVTKGFQGILADAHRLPFRSGSFDYIVCSGLLHHLVGQGNLLEYLREFGRVTKTGGYVIALEPNAFNPSGILMNIFNTIKPGITGLVPHERALSPLYLTNAFKKAGLKDVEFTAASYVWNRFPLPVSKFIARHEDIIRSRVPFNLFGWFTLLHGHKGN